MASFDLSTIDLASYPLDAAYTFPCGYEEMVERLARALALPGVSVSDEPRGASWAAWAGGGYSFPEQPVEVRMRVLGTAPDKKLGEVLLVSFVAVEGGAVVSVSEDHAFKPPRPARLAFVDASGAPVPVTQAIRDAVEALASPPAKKGGKAPKGARTSKGGAKPAKDSGAKAAAPAHDAGPRFVVERPVNWLAASPTGSAIAIAHQGSPRISLFTLDGALRATLVGSGGGMINQRRPAFSPDGARLAIGGSDVRVFDVATGEEVGRPDLPKKIEVESLRWSKDGLFVTALTPKDLVLLRFDDALAKTASWAARRAPGMLADPTPDGAVLHLTHVADGRAALVRLELATGKEIARVDVSDRFGAHVGIDQVTPEGLWVSTRTLPGARFLLDRSTYATRREVPRAPALIADAADGSGFAASPGDGAIVWYTADGRESARVTLDEVPGLTEYVAALRKTREGTATFDSLAYVIRPEVRAVALLPGGEVVAATDWAIAIVAPDGTLRGGTRF